MLRTPPTHPPSPFWNMASDSFWEANADPGAASDGTSSQGNPTPRLASRVLIIDDSASIHDDFRKILGPGASEPHILSALETELFGPGGAPAPDKPNFQVDAASQGAEGVRLVTRALAEARPYALAFVDLRMPPGWTGVQTIQKLWEVDPRLQIVMCTAYADRSWQQTLSRPVGMDQLVVMEKPFASVEVRRIAVDLTRKWQQACLPVAGHG